MADKKIVLAIDDNVQQLNEFKSILVPKYDLRVVKSASEAIGFLNKNKSDIILLDIEMPNISGFEFLHDIRKIPSYIIVPIIIVSGNSGKEFLEKARNSSAADVLTKPVNPQILINSIEEALAAVD
jgi:CheY-like chemotaxis protein